MPAFLISHAQLVTAGGKVAKGGISARQISFEEPVFKVRGGYLLKRRPCPLAGQCALVSPASVVTMSFLKKCLDPSFPVPPYSGYQKPLSPFETFQSRFLDDCIQMSEERSSASITKKDDVSDVKEEMVYTDTSVNQIYRLDKWRFPGVVGLVLFNIVAGLNWPWFGSISAESLHLCSGIHLNPY